MARKLYVGNLAFDVTDRDLEAVFAQAGVCESASVVTDKFSGRSRGFGFVEMSSNAEAERAIQQFNGHDFRGRTLKVNEAKPRTSSDAHGRGGWDRR
ncbi:MAG: RNA recognition motif domain-containing protein [Candidatus Binatia bacterium]